MLDATPEMESESASAYVAQALTTVAYPQAQI